MRSGAEPELLCASARLRLNDEDARRIRALAGCRIDWSQFTSEAEWHGLLPLAAKHLGAICADLVPGDALARLRDRAVWHAWRNLTLTGELLAILDLLSANRMRAVTFKGPALASALYGDLALRQFSDLDILVRARDIPAARALLVGRQYRPDLTLTAPEERAVLEYGCERVLRRDDFVVELHWQFAPDYFSCAPPLDALFERLIMMSIGRRQIFTLSPEDLLLALCIHGAKDCWQRLVWIADVAEIVRAQALDWTVILERATTLGARRMLFTGLCAARELLGCDLPREIAILTEADQAAGKLAGEVRARVFRRPMRFLRGGDETWFHLRSRERIADRTRYCVRLALTPTLDDWRFVRLPERLTSLRRVVRPVRLLTKYAGRPARRPAGGDGRPVAAETP